MPEVTVLRSGYFYTHAEKDSKKEKELADRFRYYNNLRSERADILRELEVSAIFYPQDVAKRKSRLRWINEELRTYRGYKWTIRAKEEFVSRMIQMDSESLRNKPTAFTLTYTSKASPVNPSKDLNRLLTNLKKNYDLGHYGWVMELTKKGQFHYHCIADIKYIPAHDFNNIWASARGYHSKNAIGGLEKINSVNGCASYASKYMVKNRDGVREVSKMAQKFRERQKINRIWGTSRGLKPELLKYNHKNNGGEFEKALSFCENNASSVFYNENCTSGYLSFSARNELIQTMQ